MTLLELAARCEAAEGPEREIDKFIHHDVRGFCLHPLDRLKKNSAQIVTGFDCLDCGADSRGNKGKRGEGLHDDVPAYTASLDAAMTLVPEGWSIGLGDLRGYTPILWRAHLRDHRPESLTEAGHSHIYREGHSEHGPALALCAAALRARASQETGQ